jgi:hypothetical protein
LLPNTNVVIKINALIWPRGTASQWDRGRVGGLRPSGHRWHSVAMADRHVDEPLTPPFGWRIAVTAASATVAVSAMLLYTYLLWWFTPEITNPGWCQHGSWWFRHDGAFVWAAVVLFGLVIPLALMYMTTSQLFRRRRWWPWPAGLLTVLIVAYPLVAMLSRASWCPFAGL